jgi:hypothetical protein
MRTLANPRPLLAAGARSYQVTIEQRPSTDVAGSGGFPGSTGWTTLGTLFMSKSEVDGDERLNADQLTSREHTRWVSAYRADCDPELVDVPKQRRLVYSGRTYDIVHARQIGLREGLEFITRGRSAR